MRFGELNTPSDSTAAGLRRLAKSAGRAAASAASPKAPASKPAVPILDFRPIARSPAPPAQEPEVPQAPQSETPEPARVASFELWPAPVFYAPIAAFVLWHGIRRGSLSLAALANAHEKEGICCWSKSALYASMGPEAKRWFAPLVPVPPRGDRAAGAVLDEALAAAAEARLDLPLVAKPDGGARGTAVQLVQDASALRRYIERFPADTAFLLQRPVPWHHEAGLLYARHPDEAHGRITSLALKIAPEVTGDGVSTLGQLIRRHPRARHHGEVSLARHRERLDTVPAAGERVTLLFARNHCAGAEFRDARHLVTPALEARIDAIARDIPSFHYGRFDIRFESAAAFRAGEAFGIVEVNGAGSEPLHAYEPGHNLIEVYRAFYETLETVFEIGAAQRARGRTGADIFDLLRGWRRFETLRATAPGTQ